MQNISKDELSIIPLSDRNALKPLDPGKYFILGPDEWGFYSQEVVDVGGLWQCLGIFILPEQSQNGIYAGHFLPPYNHLQEFLTFTEENGYLDYCKAYISGVILGFNPAMRFTIDHQHRNQVIEALTNIGIKKNQIMVNWLDDDCGRNLVYYQETQGVYCYREWDPVVEV